MNGLKVPYLPLARDQQALPLFPLREEPWEAFRDEYSHAAFSISHFNTGIRLRYVVDEPYLRAKKRPVNGPVHKDNCVEFFFAPDRDGGYYNFEINCLGSIKAAHGADRHSRTSLPLHLTKKISDMMLIELDTVQGLGRLHWELIVTIPSICFTYHNIERLQGLACRGNFTKCGDDLPVPHFKSWQPINTGQPDFHNPEAFGPIVFDE